MLSRFNRSFNQTITLNKLWVAIYDITKSTKPDGGPLSDFAWFNYNTILIQIIQFRCLKNLNIISFTWYSTINRIVYLGFRPNLLYQLPRRKFSEDLSPSTAAVRNRRVETLWLRRNKKSWQIRRNLSSKVQPVQDQRSRSRIQKF